LKPREGRQVPKKNEFGFDRGKGEEREKNPAGKLVVPLV